MEEPDYRADRRYIMEEIKRLDNKQERQGRELNDIRDGMIGVGRFEKIEERVRIHGEILIGLKVRAGVWGGLSGLIPVVLWLAFRALSPGK